ncbi:MAG: DUF1833 domain-containing protein [Proteobacteria bacterium]|nr:DUF1833 domain-containing protein [Pseudomonadota bacterium]
MADPNMEEALREAFAAAPQNDAEIIVHTLEIRHPTFVDDAGRLTSIFVALDRVDFVAQLEIAAPVRGGEPVTFVAMAFQFTLPPIEIAPRPQIQVEFDNVGREVVDQLDAAVIDGRPIRICYRPYLNGDRTGPQMSKPPVFTLSEVKVGVMKISARANTGADLSVAFPRELYKARSFPGLIGL